MVAVVMQFLRNWALVFNLNSFRFFYSNLNESFGLTMLNSYRDQILKVTRIA